MSALAPVHPGARIHSIDAVRGLALLGIFLVNIQAFGEPFGEFMMPRPGADESLLDGAAFYFVRALCEGKFYPLFSMLFGMGIALQWQRAARAGRSFTGAGIRRILILMALGVAHAALLWYGDVLFIYSFAGLLLVLLVGARVKTLLIVGGVFFAVSIMLGMGTFMLMHLGGAAPAPAVDAPSPPFDDPFKQWISGFESGHMADGPASPLWLQTETQAYSQGPYLQLFLFRITSWAFMLAFSAVSFGWHILAMFCFGAALMKHGLFTPERRPLRRRLLIIGLVAGLPLCLAAAVIPAIGPAGEVVGGLLTMVAGPFLSLGYLSAITFFVESGRARLVVQSLANVGRMALTNYLLQSLIATTIFYYYGLGMFGELSRSQRFLLVVGIYAAQICFSAAWLRLFAFGPMEWLWRSTTYLKPQPLLRLAAPDPLNPSSTAV